MHCFAPVLWNQVSFVEIHLGAGAEIAGQFIWVEHVHTHRHVPSALLVTGLAQEVFETTSLEFLAKPYHSLHKAPLVPLSHGQREENLVPVHCRQVQYKNQLNLYV